MMLSLFLYLTLFQSALSFQKPANAIIPISIFAPNSRRTFLTTGMAATIEAKPNIEVVTLPDTEFLEKKGVFSWDTWGCGVSKFPWSYGQTECCYLLAGKVTVTPSDGRPAVTISKGDYVTFPAGMSCIWDVTESVEKHYCFF